MTETAETAAPPLQQYDAAVAKIREQLSRTKTGPVVISRANAAAIAVIGRPDKHDAA
jgi:hypothetical protein